MVSLIMPKIPLEVYTAENGTGIPSHSGTLALSGFISLEVGQSSESRLFAAFQPKMQDKLPPLMPFLLWSGVVTVNRHSESQCARSLHTSLLYTRLTTLLYAWGNGSFQCDMSGLLLLSVQDRKECRGSSLYSTS